MLAGVIFYLCATVLIAAACGVVTVRQPVSAVLLLILCFFNAAALMLLLGAEFLAFILLIVYVGAVAVLFLFVVMMLDQKGESPAVPLRRFLPLSLLVGAVLLTQTLAIAWLWPETQPAAAALAAKAADGNTQALGRVLYTDYFYPFQAAGIILLTAMIGAIALAGRRRRAGVKKQNLRAQLDSDPATIVVLHKVESGKGAL